MKNTIVINLFGEPSVGKSTAATYIFSQLKMHGIDCEYVSEFAKDKVYESNPEVFKHQEYIFGKQSFKIARVYGKVEVIVTDSPIFLSIIYNQNQYLKECFHQTVLDVFNSYNNINYLLTRTHKYDTEGRFQSEQEAQEVRKHIIDTMTRYNIMYETVESNKASYDEIVKKIVGLKKGERNE